MRSLALSLKNNVVSIKPNLQNFVNRNLNLTNKYTNTNHVHVLDQTCNQAIDKINGDCKQIQRSPSGFSQKVKQVVDRNYHQQCRKHVADRFLGFLERNGGNDYTKGEDLLFFTKIGMLCTREILSALQKETVSISLLQNSNIGSIC